MDEIDLKLCLLLLKNSRTVYRDLADEVELSVNAVHSRINNLKERSIIQGFVTSLGEGALPGCLKILVHGPSRFDELDEIKDELADDDNTFKLVSTSDDYLYVHGLLQDMSDMSGYVESVPEIAGIDRPQVFLPASFRRTHNQEVKLTTDDYRIIHSLKDDSRRSFSDVADELELSTKTVRRRVKKMEENNALDYTIRWYPIHSNDFIGILHGLVTKSEKRDKILSHAKKKYHPHVFDTKKASNDPDKFLIDTWAPNLNKMHSIRSTIQKTEYVEFIKTRMFYDIEYFDTWREELLERKAG